MKNWTEDDRAEFELAVDEAWNAGRNAQERTDAFESIIRDAQQAGRQWSRDVLRAGLHDGLWKRLKEERRNHQRVTVAFAESEHKVSSIGGVPRKGSNGYEFEQLSFYDMNRDQLLNKQREAEALAFAARRNKHMIKQLIELIDSTPGAETAREAAALQHIEIGDYLSRRSA